MSDAPRELPLKITTADGRPSVMLNGTELAFVLAANGVSIRYVDPMKPREIGAGNGPDVPEVTLTFGPGALELDFDVDLLETLLDQARGA